MRKECIGCKHQGNDIVCESCGNKHSWIDHTRFEPANNTNKADSSNNMVIHPNHYNQGKIECWDAMVETYGRDATATFCKLNAFKYLWRASEKNGMEDINKAINYLNKYKELMGE